MSMLCPSCGARNLEGADECANCGGDLRTVDLPSPGSQIERTVMQLPLTSVGMTAVHAVGPETALEVVIQTLVRQKIDLVEIVESGRLLGVLSVRDIVTRVGPDYRAKLQLPVSQFMTANPETLPPDAPVTFAINKMDVGGYRHIPVVQGDRMLGVISARDVIRHLMQHSQEEVVAGEAE